MPTCITLDELPRYSPWPERLFGLSPFKVSEKTPEHLLREFNEDKWGSMLRLCEQHNVGSVESIEALIDAATPELVCLVGQSLQLMAPSAARQLYFEEVARRLERFIPATALVEFGCGYGAILLRLARRAALAHLPITGLELAPNGLAVLNRLAAHEGTPCVTGPCDLGRTCPTPVAIPKGALLYTAFTLHYVPNVGPALFRSLASYEPAIVCHFEPIVEHAASDSLLGLMTRRYSDFNRYTHGIPAALRAAEVEGILEIVHEEKAFFGLNPLLPVSLIAWRPRPSRR